VCCGLLPLFRGYPLVSSELVLAIRAGRMLRLFAPADYEGLLRPSLFFLVLTSDPKHFLSPLLAFASPPRHTLSFSVSLYTGRAFFHLRYIFARPCHPGPMVFYSIPPLPVRRASFIPPGLPGFFLASPKLLIPVDTLGLLFFNRCFSCPSQRS